MVSRLAALRCHTGGYHSVSASHLVRFPSRQHKLECLVQVRTPGRAMARFATREAHHCSPVPSHGTRLRPPRRGQSSGKQSLQQGLDVRTRSLRRRGRLRSLSPCQQMLQQLLQDEGTGLGGGGGTTGPGSSRLSKVSN